MKRRHWPNQWIFILAAVGSAAGLGNLWRFPFLAYENGGGAFVVAFIAATILIGIPLLVLEVGLGQKSQKGAPGALASIEPKWSILGWAAVMMGFIVLTYYMNVVSYALNYLRAALTLDWQPSAESFFFAEVLQITDSPLAMGGFAWPVLIGLLIAWVLVYFSAWKGVASISKVVTWTATLPFIILAILAFRVVTLDGAADGLALFFIPDWSALLSSQLWLAAFSQVFFTLTLAFGVMFAYGSLKEPSSEITKSVVLVTIGNFFVSLLAGIVIFGTLGYMALQQEVAVTEVLAAGPGLVFVVFPEAINLLPAFSVGIGVLFFATLLFLAIDSAFSLLEAVSTAVRDQLPSVSVEKISLIISIAGFVVGSLYATRAGLYYLDITDHFIVSYGLVIVGLLQAIVIGWSAQGVELINYIENRSTLRIKSLWLLSVKYLTPLFLLVLLALNLRTELGENYEGYPTEALLLFGVLPLLLAPMVGYLLQKTLQASDIHARRA
jgi:NSS family neurotransmitter:Na+ symporter